MRSQDPFIGRDILNGQFQILQKIGTGGMGSVYKALQPDMNRMVAVKILHPKLNTRKDLVSRFRREARSMSQLSHPNTTKVFLYGELDDASLYIVMEYLDGKNLNQTVRNDGPFSIERALPILIAVSGALEEAHRAGIIHRDLKPENIFLVQSASMRDYPKVLDFGLAKVGERQMRPGSVILTQEGMVFGTPEFMSPEQAQGKTPVPGSDIYALAVILYEVLTGKLPFDAKSPMDFIHLHVTATPIALNQRVAGKTFPPMLEAVISKALQKRPDDRFHSAAEFADALQAVLQEQGLPQYARSSSLRAAAPPHGQNQSHRPGAVGASMPVPSEAQGFRHPSAAPHYSAPPTIPHALGRSGPSLGLLIGVASIFLCIGAVLAFIAMKVLR
jgi:serine/threonine-protein kinase